MIHILVVNINNIKYTQDLISDLLKQTESFNLTIVDQGSTELNTKECLSSLDINNTKCKNLNVIYNKENVYLNKVWKDHS